MNARGISARDTVREAVASVSSRPVRTLLTASGIIVGVAAFVATTGLTQTASAQISAQFDAVRATEVRVQAASDPGDLPLSARAVSDLNGVVHAGLMFTAARAGRSDISILADPDGPRASVAVLGASPGAIAAAHPAFSGGRSFNEFHESNKSPVAIIGETAANRIGTRTNRTIFIDGAPFTIVGVISSTVRTDELLNAVIVPTSTAAALFNDPPDDSQIIIETSPGAAQVIGRQAAIALRPDDPGSLRVLVPPDPATLRQSIERDVATLLYGLSLLALVIGALAITNAQLLAINERRHEIGLRRALGARRRGITAQIAVESAITGTIAGGAGAAIGLTTTLLVAYLNSWTPTIQPPIVFAAVPLGLVVALLGGLLPAYKASRLAPAVTLRST